MRKRLFSICVALVALMVTPLAAWALNVSPGNVSGGPGASITVPINISDVGGGLAVDAFDITINFDPDVLTFVEADKTGTLTSSFTSVAGNIIGPGTVKVAGILFGTPINISSPGVFVNIKFTVKATAYKNSALSLSDFKSDIAGASTDAATFRME